MWLRTNLNAKVNQNYQVTLNRKSEGQGHRERSQFRRSHQGLFPCKVSSLYWLMWPRTNLNAEVNQNVDRQTDGRTEGQTDRRTSSIHKPELLCNPAKNLTKKMECDCHSMLTWNIWKSYPEMWQRVDFKRFPNVSFLHLQQFSAI